MGRSLAPTNVVLRIRKDSLAMVLVLIALVSLTTVYRARPLGTNEHHVAKIRTEPTQQRNLQTTNFESASPVAYFMPLPSPHYVRQPSNADRTFTPRRLPGSYYNRPPPSVLS